MNISDIAHETLAHTVAYFQAHYDINETNAEEAAEKIARFFVANTDKLVRTVIEAKMAS
jgi:hypothetical protein